MIIVNKILIIGGDHHNGLNLARIIGKNGYDVIAYVVADHSDSFIAKSKYIKQTYVFETYKDAYNEIKKMKCDEKPILIPYSDGAEMELDLRLSEFESDFICPSINQIQGEVARLMDKKNQYEWARAHGIHMAFSEEIKLNEQASDIPEGINFPVILKPAVSALGQKGDIVICHDITAYNQAIQMLLEKQYERVVIQPFLKVDYEIDVFGCICKNAPHIYLVPTKTLRQWPPLKGTNSFSQIIVDQDLVNSCKEVIMALKSYGFYGLYDIELLVVDGEIYLNEINFRNSGDDYMVLSQEFYYPVYWIQDVLGQKRDTLEFNPSVDSFAMTPVADIMNVRTHRLGVVRWLKDFCKTKDYALWLLGDNKPMLAYYANRLKKSLKKRIFGR